MEKNDHTTQASQARKNRREQIVLIAQGLVEQCVNDDFDAVHSPLCAIDVVMVAGAPWLKDALEKDYAKDESGYKKIGGGANSPDRAYFYRSSVNLMHFLKRQGLYVPRGGKLPPAAGMACFLDWDDRGRFNFAPDRSGIIVETDNNQITKIILPMINEGLFMVQKIELKSNLLLEQAIIGYSDLP